MANGSDYSLDPSELVAREVAGQGESTTALSPWRLALRQLRRNKVALVALGVLFFALPTATAYVFGALCGWLALSAWREAFRRRADR